MKVDRSVNLVISYLKYIIMRPIVCLISSWLVKNPQTPCRFRIGDEKRMLCVVYNVKGRLRLTYFADKNVNVVRFFFSYNCQRDCFFPTFVVYH